MSGEQLSSPRSEERFWTRGYLPHFDSTQPQFLTFRVQGSLPAQVYQEIRSRYEHREAFHREARIREAVENYLDVTCGEQALADPRVASILAGAMKHFDGRRYELHAWVIMPNHVHVLVTPFTGHTPGSIVKSWKVWTARRANAVLGRKGAFWHDDYFDRYIRTDSQMEKVTNYIEWNPVKAGLCDKPEDWRWGSAWTANLGPPGSARDVVD